MYKKTLKLTPVGIDSLSYDGRDRLISDGSNLYLFVRRNSKSWVYVYKSSGKQQRIGLGSYPALGLADARREARELNRLRALGVDVAADRREQRQFESEQKQGRDALLFKTLGDGWFHQIKRERHWSEGHASRQYALLVNHVYPYLSSILITDIKERDVAALLEGVKKRGHTETAIRARGVIREVFDYACGKGLLDSRDNFMRYAQNLGLLKKPKARSFAAFDGSIEKTEKLGELLRAMRGYQGRGIVVWSALNLMPLLAQRPGQMRQMKWADLDLKQWLWTCPPLIMKQSTSAKGDSRTQAHIVPLPRQAIEILYELKHWTGEHEYVFASLRSASRPISDNTVNAALRSLGFCTKNEITAHGFRSLMQTLSVDHLGMPRDWADRHLAHKPVGGLSDTYDRSQLVEQRFELVQKYADFLDNLAETAGVGAPRRIVKRYENGRLVVEHERSLKIVA